MKQIKTAGRRPKSRTKKVDTRASILAAARRIFARQGLDGTSVREVAEAAKVNNAMIYYHFKDKEDLYQAVLADSFFGLNNIWSEEVFRSTASTREKIQKYVEKFIRYEQANEDIRRIVAMEFAGSGNLAACEKYFADNYTRLIKIFKDGMKNGDLKKSDPSLAVASLFGIIVHNFIMQPMTRNILGKKANLSPKKFGAYVTDFILNGLAP
ncbi:MAG TPA: TetR/AcrR family transcriptional regulator [Nitrospirota bacterium]|nr:TetR/AcrR family transcriptional regulator [Nitrospirota bacterium]